MNEKITTKEESREKTIAALLDSPETARKIIENEKLSPQERTTNAVFAAFGLNENDAEKAIQKHYEPIPRNKRHYQFTDSKGKKHYPDLTIDEALKLCKSYGVKTNEKELREKGVRFSDYGFVKDAYQEGAIEHESM